MRWALTPPSHPYPYGRLFSSTLLYPYGHQAINLRGALCCSDFPLTHKVSAIERVCGGKDSIILRSHKIKVKSNKKTPKEQHKVAHSEYRLTLYNRLQACLNSFRGLLITWLVEKRKHILLISLNTWLVERIYTKDISRDTTTLLEEVE